MKFLLFTTTTLMASALLVSGQFFPTSSEIDTDGISSLSPYQSPLSRLAANLYRSPLSSFTSGASPLHSSYQSDDVPSSDAPMGGAGNAGAGAGAGTSQDSSSYYNQQQPLQRSPTHQQGYYGGNPGNDYRQQPQNGLYNQMNANYYGGANSGAQAPMMGSRPRSNANRDNDDRDDDEGSYGPGNGANLFDQANNNNNNNYGVGLHQSANNNAGVRNNNYNNNDEDSADENDDEPGQGQANGGLNQAASHQRGPNHYGAGAAPMVGNGYGGFADANAGLGFDLSGVTDLGYNGYGQAGYGNDDDQSGGKRAKSASAPNYGMAYGQAEADAYNQGRNQRNNHRQRDTDSYDDNDNDDD